MAALLIHSKLLRIFLECFGFIIVFSHCFYPLFTEYQICYYYQVFIARPASFYKPLKDKGIRSENTL